MQNIFQLLLEEKWLFKENVIIFWSFSLVVLFLKECFVYNVIFFGGGCRGLNKIALKTGNSSHRVRVSCSPLSTISQWEGLEFFLFLIWCV